MAGYDVLVIGGGPAGYSAALAAAQQGARVGLVEAERAGGACVNFACIPTNILASSAIAFLEARELDVMGVFSAGEQFNLGRAVARKDALVQQLGRGVEAVLRSAGVAVTEGRARFTSPNDVSIALRDGGQLEVQAHAFVIATGSRWEPKPLAGYPQDRLVTADAVQRLAVAPESVLILADTPGDVSFGAEYAVLLAAAGTAVTLATSSPTLFPGLDSDIRTVATEGLEALGVRVLESAEVISAADSRVRLHTLGAEVEVVASLVVVADPRIPATSGLGLEAAGVATEDGVPVDRACRTNQDHIFAAGDVTGGAMLTNAANHMGEVAGTNAAGGEAITRLAAMPRLIHTLPECGWVGMDEASARALGFDVVTGSADLAFNARALALGARTGALKLVAERELGQVLGVHVAGPGTGEILGIASAAMQAEIPYTDVAAMVQWHPSLAESLAEAAARIVTKESRR